MKITRLLFLCYCLSGALLSADEGPNIVFLLSDDQTTYSMGCYGNPDVQTPNLDQLAKDGMVFDNHYVTTAICMASRASIMTGMYEYKTGCNFEHGALMREHFEKSYTVLLREAGYRTAIAGKIGFEVTDTPNMPGELPEDAFDKWGAGPGQTKYDTKKNKSIAHYADEYPHSTRAYGAFGRDFILESAKMDQPFLLSISFKAPHQPTTPDPAFNDIYKGKTFTRPGNYGREHGEHFSEQSRQGRQYDRWESWDYDKNYDGVMSTYNQQIYGIDVAVGMIREALEQAGVADNTVIIYTSDNGFLCGSHGYGSKVLPYEEASRVPLLMFDPRQENSGKQLRSEALTGNIDFAPTILELAGLPIPENVDGKSLLPLYANPEASHHESLTLINVWGPDPVHSLAVVTKDWKYVLWNYSEGDFTPAGELYYLSKDPLELVNEASNPEYSQALQEMQSRYDRAVEHWKTNAVPYHKYEEFSDFFKR